MESKTNNNYNVAASAIELLKTGVSDASKPKILAAYEMVEHESFEWDNLDHMLEEWCELVDEANLILYED